MKNLTKLAATLLLFSSLGAFAQSPDLIYAEMLDGVNSKAYYSYGLSGRGTHNGYISVFNFPRKVVESMLPPQFGLTYLKSGASDVYPVIVLWGEMTETCGNNFGVCWPSGIDYREWQFYIPGVFQRDHSPQTLFTYVPRIYVDSKVAQTLGDRFFYRKVLLDQIDFSLEYGMPLGKFADMRVDSRSKKYRSWSGLINADKQWRAIFTYLPGTDIMGENSEAEYPRCSGFDWQDKGNSKIATAEATMTITSQIVPGMDRSILNQPLKSVVTYEVRDWYFLVAFEYNYCRN